MSDPLHELAATIYTNSRPRLRINTCTNCEQLYRTIERLLALEQIQNGTPPEPDQPETFHHEPVPETLQWILDRHPDLWWLVTLPRADRDWYRQHALHSHALLAHYPGVTPLTWQAIFDERLRKTQRIA